jgi:DNA-directed RNA polymerase II subunit RPB2
MTEHMTEALSRKLFKSHDRVNGYAKFQKHSYDHFMTTLLPHIIDEFSNPTIVHDSVSTGRRHVISFGKVTMGTPSHRESDGKVCSLLPEEARLRQLDYSLLVMVDVTHEVFPLDPKNMTASKTMSADDDIFTEWTMHLPNMEKRVVHREVPFFEMPVMVQSRFCALNGISRVPGRGWDGSGVKQPSSECPRDEGGYFIIRGLDRTLQMQESLRNNVAFVFPVKQPSKYGFMCEVRSRFESKMRSSSTLRINVSTRKGGTPPTVMVALPFLPMEVPLLAVFILLGFRDVQALVGFVRGSSVMPGDMQHHVDAILNHSCRDMSENDLFEYVGRTGTKETTLEARKKYVIHLMANEFLPHLGLQNTATERVKKALFLGTMVRKLMATYCAAPMGFRGSDVEALDIPGVDDRDHYANKRLDTAGIMIARLLRQHTRKFIKTIKRTLSSLIENRRPLDVGNVVNTHTLTAGIRYAFRTGNWSVQRTNTGQNVGITQILNRMSQLALKSQIGRINTPMNRDGKMTHPRQAHLSTLGILCPNETPEGVGCGLVKNLAVMAHIRVGSDKRVMDKALFTFMDVQPLGDHPELEHLVFVNGDIVGRHPNPPTLARQLRAARRNNVIPYDASVVCKDGGVYVSIDPGCCMRPVIVAENLDRMGPILEGLKLNPNDELWTLCVQNGIIEYIDKEEENETRIAVTVAEYIQELGEVDDPEPYTHIEVSPSAMLGHCARQIPFADRNQAPRNIYQASMGKQAVAVPTLPYMDRFDAQMHVPYYTQRPLAGTGAEDPEFGMGINAVVAIMTHTGFNQEDSVIMNKGFIDRGGFRSTYYTTYTSEEQSTGADPECFENPDTCEGDVIGLKQADYSGLDDVGTVGLNTPLVPGTVLIGKTVSTPHIEGRGERNVKRDNSLVFAGADNGSRVDKVMITNNREGVNCQRVRVRSTRIPLVGDKFSSRHGQKGTVGVILPQVDMPFSAQTGMSPDIIINPCAIPSRMTIAHLVECVASKTGVVLGKFANGEPFRKMNVQEDICQALHDAGYERHGNERMISGTSGEMFEATVFMGPTFYQRLKHMVSDKIHSRATGPRTAVTRQPTEGRSNHGGLRLGEMERDCLVSHGVSNIIQERYLYASDAYPAPFCKDCGVLAEHAHNPAFGETVRGKQARCRLCGKNNVREIQVTYSYKLLIQELAAMGISVKHEIEEK